MKKLILVMAVISLLSLGIIVQADTAVSWNTGSAYMDNLGNTTSDGQNVWSQTNTNCDKVTLGLASGSLNLNLGTPQIVVVNPLSFEIGWTGDMGVNDTKSNNYTLTRNITVNGITKSLVQTMTHGVTYYQDSLIINAGASVTFGNIIVTPLGWKTGFFSDSAGVYTQTSPSWHTILPVSAEFSLSPTTSLTPTTVPEPGTILAALSILGPAAMIFRRRKSA